MHQDVVTNVEIISGDLGSNERLCPSEREGGGGKAKLDDERVTHRGGEKD